MSEHHVLTVQVHEEDGSFWATVVELPGVFATGDDMDELADCLREAIGLYLDVQVDGHWADTPPVQERQFEYCDA